MGLTSLVGRASFLSRIYFSFASTQLQICSQLFEAGKVGLKFLITKLENIDLAGMVSKLWRDMVPSRAVCSLYGDWFVALRWCLVSSFQVENFCTCFIGIDCLVFQFFLWMRRFFQQCTLRWVAVWLYFASLVCRSPLTGASWFGHMAGLGA